MRTDVGSIPLARSNPSQGWPALANTIWTREGTEILGWIGLRWGPLHAQPRFDVGTTADSLGSSSMLPTASHIPGLMPTCRVNTRVKWLWSAWLS